MRKNILTVVLVLVSVLSCSAQTEYPIFRDTQTYRVEDTGKLSLSIDNLNYLRNYEWFGKIPLSYTLLGYQFTPQLKYQLNQYISFKGGIYIRREFGRPGYVVVEPVFTAKYQKKGLTFIMGTLEGGLNHRFIEPIYNIERVIQGHMGRVGEEPIQVASRTKNEQGIQLKLDKKRFWMDWFIDWRESIIFADNFREQLNTGISMRALIVDAPGVKVTVPLQALVVHHGGQISWDPAAIESIFNSTAGISFAFPTNGGLIKSIQTDHYIVGYSNISGEKHRIFNKGDGWLSTLLVKTQKNIDVELRYWRGHKFYGPVGLPLYNSISEKIEGLGEVDRELVFATFIYNKQLFPNVWIDLRLEPYYDVRNAFMEYGYSAFLRFNKEFFLKKLR